jgi:acetolactate synthase-1/3 small subunit
MERFVVSALVQNHPGVLSRISGLFSRRGFNIESLSVGETLDPSVSRMTVSALGDEEILEQLARQLEKLEDVLSILRLEPGSGVFRELVLVKVKATPETRGDIVNIARIFRARIVDVSRREMVLEITGERPKIDGLLDLLAPYGIPEIARTGLTALQRGASTLGRPEPAETARHGAEQTNP